MIPTIESRIIGGVGIIRGGGRLDIAIIINNRGVGIIVWGGGGRVVGQGWINSVGGLLVLIC